MEYLQILPTNETTLIILQSALILLLLCTVVGDICIYVGSTWGSSVAVTVKRGDRSGKMIYVVYATSMAACWALVDGSNIGRAVSLMFVNFILLTYLFSSPWFRNRVFFPVSQWLRQD